VLFTPIRIFLDFLQQAVARIANTVVAFEPVNMLMHRDQIGRCAGLAPEDHANP